MWNKLSMKDRAEYIKLGVANGITSLDEIRNVYNQYASGGPLKLSYPEVTVKEEPWADSYFKNNINVAGMAIGGGLNGVGGPRRVIINPYSENINREAVLQNERLRHYFEESNFKLPNVSEAQMNKYKGTAYEGDTVNIGRTEAARYLTGDKHLLSEEQKIVLDNIFSGGANKYAEGGPINSDSTSNDRGFLGLNGEEWLDIGTSMIPIYGTYKDAKEFYNEPSWENAMWLGISAISEVPFLKWVKAGKIAKAGKAVDKAVEVAEKYSKVKKKVDRMREIPNIKPSRVRKASGEAGRLHLEMLKTTGEALQSKEAAKYFSLPPETSITAGAIADYVQALTNDNNKYAEGGGKDSWKPWYWFTPEYEGNNLKEAIFKAYDDGRENEDIIYNGKAYKASLSEDDLNEYRRYKNRSITPEDVVNSYIENVLYTMENPKNKGYKNGKYYSYADSSSPLNIGPGINYTSDLAKNNNLDFSDKTGYTREYLDNIVKQDLLEKMEGINKDLHNMYGSDADTMSLGNRMILLDIAHNVRPRGRKRANMPKGWPSLVSSMMSGNSSKARKNTNSGSTRRQEMRNDLLWQNIIDKNTVKNR